MRNREEGVERDGAAWVFEEGEWFLCQPDLHLYLAQFPVP